MGWSQTSDHVCAHRVAIRSPCTRSVASGKRAKAHLAWPYGHAEPASASPAPPAMEALASLGLAIAAPLSVFAAAAGARPRVSRTSQIDAHHGAPTDMLGMKDFDLKHSLSPRPKGGDEECSGNATDPAGALCACPYSRAVANRQEEIAAGKGGRDGKRGEVRGQEPVTVSSDVNRLSWMSGSVGMPRRYLVNWASMTPAATLAQ